MLEEYLALIQEAGFTKMPKGWTKKSVKKAGTTIGKDVGEKPTGKGYFEKCVEKMKGKIDNPEGYCASMKDYAHGSTHWRGKGKSEKQAKKDAKAHPMKKLHEQSTKGIEIVEGSVKSKSDIEEAAKLEVKLRHNHGTSLSQSRLYILNNIKHNKAAHLLFAKQGDEFIGFAFTVVIMERGTTKALIPIATLASLYVDPKQQRTGTGKALVEGVKGWVKSKGIKILKVGTDADEGNEAHKFYRSVGFKPVTLYYKMKL